MKHTTIFKYRFTFEYWVLTSDTQGEITYEKFDDRVGMMIPSGSTHAYMVCEEALSTPMQIRNVRDASGNPVFMANGEEYPMYVTTIEPQLDPFSNVIAYKHQIKRELPRDYYELLKTVVDA